jgi:hypothetical protein
VAADARVGPRGVPVLPGNPRRVIQAAARFCIARGCCTKGSVRRV